MHLDMAIVFFSYLWVYISLNLVCATGYRVIVWSSYDIALSMVYIVLTCLISLTPGFGTDQRAKQLGNIQGTLYATVAATSLTSTLIICRSIYVNTAESGERYRRRYRHVVDILVQSAAVHSTSMLLAAIFQYLNTAQTKSQSVDVAIYYFVPLSVPVLVSRINCHFSFAYYRLTYF